MFLPHVEKKAGVEISSASPLLPFYYLFIEDKLALHVPLPSPFHPFQSVKPLFSFYLIAIAVSPLLWIISFPIAVFPLLWIISFALCGGICKINCLFQSSLSAFIFSSPSSDSLFTISFPFYSIFLLSFVLSAISFLNTLYLLHKFVSSEYIIYVLCL